MYCAAEYKVVHKQVFWLNELATSEINQSGMLFESIALQLLYKYLLNVGFTWCKNFSAELIITV